MKVRTTISLSNSSMLLEHLKSIWDKLQNKPGVFKYKINDMKEKVLDEGYLLQLNSERQTKRRMPEHIDNVCQPFDCSKFNFTQASPDEVICDLQRHQDSDIHTVLVNVSPISRYHSLLCPSVNKCLPQVVTADSLHMALDLVLRCKDRDLRIGLNGMCAFASVNHLHYHLLFEKKTLPIETVKWIPIKGPLNCIKDFPIPAFCFEVKEDSTSISSKEIYKIIDYFLQNSIAHNVLISLNREKDNVARAILWPRKSMGGVKQLNELNAGFCELSGWFIIHNEVVFQQIGVEDLKNELSKWKYDDFDTLCKELMLLF